MAIISAAIIGHKIPPTDRAHIAALNYRMWNKLTGEYNLKKSLSNPQIMNLSSNGRPDTILPRE